MSEWRDVVGFEGFYSVSDAGEVRNERTGYLMKSRVQTRGYCYTFLSVNGARTNALTHKLVAEAFLGPRPDLAVINHKNGDKTDNRTENLEYCTQSYNTAHAFRVLGRKPTIVPGEQCGTHKLTEDQVREARRLHAEGHSTNSIAKRYGVHTSTMDFAIKRLTWKHVA